jgi:parallel beta-helix repeat protein
MRRVAMAVGTLALFVAAQPDLAQGAAGLFITSAPLWATSDNTPTFEWAIDDEGRTFRCALTPGTAIPFPSTACVSPTSYGPLTDGTYTFAVEANFIAGHQSDSRTFTVDTVAPDTTITAGPTGLTSTRSPSFSFTGSQSGTTFECKLDGPGTAAGPWQPCSSPLSYAGLVDGAYTLSVRATDPARNLDATPAVRSFTVDGTVPDTSITSGPSGVVMAQNVTFGFASPDTSASFQCKLDGPDDVVGTWGTCTTPKAYNGLANNSAYVFSVRARDAAGNADATPATRAFSVIVCHKTVSSGATPEDLYASLQPNETGCFRAGSYGTSNTYINMLKVGAVMRNYPGEYPQIKGRWRLDQAATGAKIIGLRLNVDSTDPLAKVGILILGDDQVVRGNDITERTATGTRGTGVCVHAARTSWNGPNRFKIENNRVHDCGVSDNHQHGIYIDAGNGSIRNNVVYRNADRGVQLYPRAKSVVVESNTIAYNGNGLNINDDILFNGAENLGDATHDGCCSTGNTARFNVISHSTMRGGANSHPFNVEAPSLDGAGNTASDNCLFATTGIAQYDTNGGVEAGTETRLTLTPGYPIANPAYQMAVPDDYRIGVGSGCGTRGAAASVADPRLFLGGAGPAA